MNERSDEEIIDEIENANGGEGPDPIYTVDDPTLIPIYMALMKVRSAETELDNAVAAAREAGRSWQAIGELLGMTRQGALKRYAALTNPAA